jgi:hypothetical protein
MERDLIIEDNKKYCYVISYYSQNDYTIHKNTDISIFEIDEWKELLNKSKIFKKNADRLNSENDHNYISIDKDYKKAVYYLYHNCDYCYQNDFTSFEYYIGNNQDIYERAFIETKNTDRNNISIDGFRGWIIDNYDNINKNYDIINMHNDK